MDSKPSKGNGRRPSKKNKRIENNKRGPYKSRGVKYIKTSDNRPKSKTKRSKHQR